jgi:disulfide bond formation protein DsbB
MNARAGERRFFAWVFGLAVAAVGVALISQHVFDMQPCPWCVLQRLLFVLIALVAALGFVVRSARWRSVAAVVGGLLAASGAAAALWQHRVAAASASCNLTLADRIMSGLGLDSLVPPLFAATASCAEAQVQLLGVPYEYWSFAAFALIEVTLIVCLVRVRKSAR